MPSRVPQPVTLLLMAAGFLCLHVAGIAVFRGHAQLVATYPFLLLAPLLALGSCLWAWQESAPQKRLAWGLFSVGLLLWSCGMLLAAWEDLFAQVPFSVAFYSDFVYFLYGVPMLLAISSPAESERLPLFLWMDGVEVALTAYLTYITIFSVVPFTSRTNQPISVDRLVMTYHAENIVLAVAATLRLLAQPRAGEKRRFYKLLCAFLWTYAVVAGIYNTIAAHTEGHALDPMVDLPFLLLSIAILSPAPETQEADAALPEKPLALFIDNASPIFYTLSLAGLGLTVVRTHFWIGVAAILLAVAVYGIRVITVQGRYMQSQRALKDARDRLEEISLRDSLTNIANRRCFDQTLAVEWRRAMRMQHPLSLLLIDIDHFKALNDHYGHPYGDECLIEVAAAMQSVLVRGGDLLARYGGEEFAVILPATNSHGADAIASHMRDAVRALRLEHEAFAGGFVSISIGIASADLPQDESPRLLIKASDEALYRAKLNGRDRIEHAEAHRTVTVTAAETPGS